jgi:hypothetical protein
MLRPQRLVDMKQELEPVTVPARKSYASPKLVVFGALETLTAAGSPTCIENGAGANCLNLDEGSQA